MMHLQKRHSSHHSAAVLLLVDASARNAGHRSNVPNKREARIEAGRSTKGRLKELGGFSVFKSQNILIILRY